MIIFRTLLGEVVKIKRFEEEKAFIDAKQSKDPNAYFLVGDTCYYIRAIAWDREIIRRRGPRIKRFKLI
jgi:hypothetical protein